jgi:phenylacetate-CoA ligase
MPRTGRNGIDEPLDENQPGFNRFGGEEESEPPAAPPDPERVSWVGGTADKLESTLKVASRSPLYQKLCGQGLSKRQRAYSQDLRVLPFTTKGDLRRAYPFGAIAVPLNQIVSFNTSSGTSGAPVGIGFTRNDILRILPAHIGSFADAGIDRTDKVQVMVHGALAAPIQSTLEEIGAMSIITGPGNDIGQLSLMSQVGSTVLIGVPSYLLHLGQARGDSQGRAVRVLLTTGEPLTEYMRVKLESVWRAEVFDRYGSVELGSAFSECEEHNGHHIFADHFLAEMVDPESGDPAPVRGEFVFTTLSREGSPLIRYRTGDLVRLEYDPCPCGRESPRLFFERRIDEMVKIKGTAVYPSTLQKVIDSFPEVDNYQVLVEKESSLDKLVIRIEAEGKDRALEEMIREAVKGATNLTPVVEFASPDSLRGKRKTKRFIDAR